VISILSAVGGLGGLATIIAAAFWLGKKLAVVDYRLDSMEKRLLEFQYRIAEVSRHAHEFVIDVLSYEGVIKRSTIELLKNEITRIFSALRLQPLANPLDEKTVKRILEILAKDEPTLEEAEELYRIAVQLLYEKPSSEIWKLLTYSRWWIVYHLKKRVEEEEKRSN